MDAPSLWELDEVVQAAGAHGNESSSGDGDSEVTVTAPGGRMRSFSLRSRR